MRKDTINMLQQPCTDIHLYADKTTVYVGETIIFTVSVTPTTESYLVEVRENTNLIGNCTTSGGTCSVNWNTTGLAAGTYYISAHTTNCAIYPMPITLLPACTGMYLSPNKSTVYVGETVKFTVGVEPSTESYPVEIRDQNNNLLGACTTSGGTCAVNWNTVGLAAGTYYISATTNNCGPTSQAPITLLPACTSINLSANKTSVYIGERVIFTVTTQPSTQPYTVELNLPNQSLPYRSCTTSGGACTVEWNTTELAAGAYTITANVVGQCTSVPLIVTLMPHCTSVNMTTDKTSASVGSTITFDVIVYPISQSYPVQISDQNNNLWGVCMTSGGTCSISWDTTGLNIGTYIMTARVVVGDLVLCEQSNSIDITLTPACTSITMSADKISLYMGETVTFTVMTQPSTQPYIVGFKDQNNNIYGSCLTIDGTCSFVWDPGLINPGTYTITAYVLSSTQCNTSKEITLIPTCTLVNITPNKTTANIGESIIFNVSVNPISQSFNVQLIDQDNSPIGNACTTSNGICSIIWNTTGLTVKSYIITAKVIDGAAGQCISTPVAISLQEPSKALGGSDVVIITIVGLTAAAIYVAKYKK